MASRNYELKKGVVLQAFGNPSKTCTNDTITDELGDWYMANYPQKIIYFDRVRSKPAPAPLRVTILPPKESEEIKEPEKIAEVSEVTEVKKKYTKK